MSLPFRVPELLRVAQKLTQLGETTVEVVKSGASGDLLTFITAAGVTVTIHADSLYAAPTVVTPTTAALP